MKKTLLILIFAIVVYGCGARKVTRTESQEAKKVEITDNTLLQKKEEVAVKVAETTVIDDQNKTKTTETIYKPVDATKEATVTTPDGKKHSLNNAEIFIKETEQQNNTKTDNSRKYKIFHKLESSKHSESDIKTDSSKNTADVKVDREAWSIWNWLWVLIPIGIVVLLFKNRLKISNWIENIWWV